LFAIPLLTLLPVKIVALYWLSHGHKLLGIGVIISAKLIGTGITARLFMLTQPTLMKLAWFARLFARWMRFKDSVLTRARQSAAWQQWLAFKHHVGGLISNVRNWWRR